MSHKVTTVQRADLSLDSLATIYGCCGLFDMCSDADLMSLSFEKQNKFLDWLSWQITSVCTIKRNFLNWVRPEDCSEGYLGDPCGDAHGVEFGTCGFELRDFGRLRRHGPTRDATRNEVRFCEAQPRYRLDGSPITDDREFDMRLATEGITQDLKRYLVSGNKATPGLFDGLQQSIKTGYVDPDGRRCQSMDSIIINWNSNNMAGGNGITWNGAPVANTFAFVDVLGAVIRRIKQRIQWAPALDAQPLAVGDIVLVLPSFAVGCLLDQFTCWGVCKSSVDMVAFLNSLEGRRFRDGLNGGLFGAGYITIDGLIIPLISYDWGLIQGPTTADIYVLTGKVGNIRLLNGQLLDMRGASNGYPEVGYVATDGGRLLTWVESDGTCVRQFVEMGPRLLNWAPWAQVRFEDVVCNVPGGALSPDPCDSSYFIESSFSVASCPPA